MGGGNGRVCREPDEAASDRAGRDPVGGLTWVHTCTTLEVMGDKKRREAVGIRIERDLLHQAKIAAVIQRMTLGRWLEEAIEEKVQRERERELGGE